MGPKTAGGDGAAWLSICVRRRMGVLSGNLRLVSPLDPWLGIGQAGWQPGLGQEALSVGLPAAAARCHQR
jgi:hypothetical protein